MLATSQMTDDDFVGVVARYHGADKRVSQLPQTQLYLAGNYRS